MRFLANENFALDAVEALRRAGHDVGWVRTDAPGSPDAAVLARAQTESRVLLTFDKDFGDLAFHANLPAACGVVLFRLAAGSSSALAALVLAALQSRSDWSGHFSVVEPGRIRMRPLAGPPPPDRGRDAMKRQRDWDSGSGEMDEALDRPDIPSEWQWKKLGDICTPRKALVSPQGGGDLPYVGLEHVDSGDTRLSRWGKSSDVRSSKTEFQPGDVLYGKLRPYLDKAVLAPCKGVCTTELLSLRAIPGLAVPEFLVCLLHTAAFVQHAVDTTGGTNLPRTSWSALCEFVVALPALHEQRSIAHVLRTVQQAKEATERIVAAARQLKQSLLRRLFTYGPTPLDQAGRVALKETEVGPIPEHWRMALIGDVAAAVGSGVTPRGGAKTYLAEGVPLIRSQNVLMNRLELSDVAYISQETHQMMNRSALMPGDVLLNITGASIGRTAVVPADLRIANVNQHVCRIRLAKGCLPGGVSLPLNAGEGQPLGQGPNVIR